MKRAFFIAGFLCACGGIVGDATDGGADGADAATTPPPTGPIVTFAIDQIRLGEADPTGVGSNTAWRAYGRDVDGLVTTKDSTDVCTLQPGAPKFNQTDGNDGIDNAWGAVFLPILQTMASLPTPSQVATDDILAGKDALLVQTVGLTSDTSQTGSNIVGQIFAGTLYDGGTPTFDSTTDWPVDTRSLVAQSISSGAIAHFDHGTVQQGVFDTGVITGPVLVPMWLQGVPLSVTIHDAEIRFDHTGGAANGMISGVLDTQEFVAMLKNVVPFMSVSLCGPALAGVIDQVMQAQDILADGTNHAGTACSGISIGIGFELKPVANPTKVGSVALTSPCQ